VSSSAIKRFANKAQGAWGEGPLRSEAYSGWRRGIYPLPEERSALSTAPGRQGQRTWAKDDGHGLEPTGGERQQTHSVYSASMRRHKKLSDLGSFDQASERRRMGKEDDTCRATRPY
jgi:hypothetical protein